MRLKVGGNLLLITFPFALRKMETHYLGRSIPPSRYCANYLSIVFVVMTTFTPSGRDPSATRVPVRDAPRCCGVVADLLPEEP